MAELLRLDNVSAGYGEAVVLEDISLSVAEGDSVALLGRNGMGKTTLLVTLMGLTRLHRGAIRLRGADIGALPTHRRVHSGLGWVPQERCIFASLTVEEHLTAVARPGHWNVVQVYRIFPRLEERRRNLGNELSGGEQQMLAIARALMVNPRLLLLDEPGAGIPSAESAELFGVIAGLPADVTILLIEHDMDLVFRFAQWIIVLVNGQVLTEGTPAAIAADERVKEVYLGEAQHG